MQVRSRLTSAAALAAAALSIATASAGAAPSAIPLPDGFGPESLTGHGATLYAGSSTTGAVWAGNAHTGRGRVLVPAQEGRSAFGTAVAGKWLVVAGGTTGNVYVYDRRTGADVRTFALGDGAILNDVVVRNGVAWVTDTLSPVLWKVTLDGSAPPQKLPLVGYPTPAGSPGADGLVLDGATVILGDIGSEQLLRVNPATGVSTPIDLGGAKLPMNDGLLRIGNRVWVAEGTGHLAEVRVTGGASGGQVLADQQLADAIVDVAKAGGALWYMDAAFQQEPDPTAKAVIRRVPKALS
jgi:outer membrane protein assembly factor BamB